MYRKLLFKDEYNNNFYKLRLFLIDRSSRLTGKGFFLLEEFMILLIVIAILGCMAFDIFTGGGKKYNDKFFYSIIIIMSIIGVIGIITKI